MYRIDLPHMCWVLENLVQGVVVNQIGVDEQGAVAKLREAVAKAGNGQILLSTIFKFAGSKDPIPSSENWIVLVDECHRFVGFRQVRKPVETRAMSILDAAQTPNFAFHRHAASVRDLDYFAGNSYVVFKRRGSFPVSH